MQTNSMPSVKMWSAREFARLATELNVIKGIKESGPLLASHSEQSAVGQNRRKEKSGKREWAKSWRCTR